ncbi:DUF7218 family protein [Pseudonocardia lacus]|uniref:DUF7218 family protein n=1 Tax=Pseudonocardia lacus TaxID=2835865 RepID=UPI001BDD5B57|nr:Rho termination factor N-terminal domain-containing protein [Pseudonocardia lacus]
MAGSSVKDKKTYEKVKESGASKEKAARVANASAAQGRKKVAKKGGKSSKYDDMSKEELLARAKKVGIKGRSKMKKKDLVDALRNH